MLDVIMSERLDEEAGENSCAAAAAAAAAAS